MGEATNPAGELRLFRERLYASLGRRRAALFELTDAMLAVGSVSSPPHLSLATVHRRGRGSLYAALSRGRVDAEALRDLLADHGLGGEPDRARVYVVDRSSWPRCDAECSPERGYYYYPNRHSAGQPIVAGWSYQLIVQLGFERDSWVAPADARRVSPAEDADLVAAEQVRALLDRLPGRSLDPLFVFDAGYDPVRLQLELENLPVQLLVRLHSDRVFYADPETPEKKPVGRPFRHGERFDLKLLARDIVADCRPPWEILDVPSGSRSDVRDALNFATEHGIRPRVTERPLEEADAVLREMAEGRLRDRVVLTLP